MNYIILFLLKVMGVNYYRYGIDAGRNMFKGNGIIS